MYQEIVFKGRVEFLFCFVYNETISDKAEIHVQDFKFQIHSASKSHSLCNKCNAYPTL